MRRIATNIADVFVVEAQVHADSRGFFTETYHRDKLRELGLDIEFVQDNHSLSVRAGTIRGLHYQLPPAAQAKLVRVPSGAVYDVAVDLRRTSATFGAFVAVILTADNHRQLFIPAGFAHGFCTLTAHTHVMYKVDAYYSPAHDCGIRWDDPVLAIPWPETDVIVSDKDAQHPLLRDAQPL